MRAEPKVVDSGVVPSAVERLRLAVVSLALTLLTFAQSSGLEAADTKLDLLVAPARLLRRSLTMWDATANAGQVQDQIYGYLFPMGPFYLLGHLAKLDPWVIQRGWESVLVVAAFLGTVRLAGHLGVPGFWPRVVAGLVYALSPRMLSELMTISSELMPMAALPWVLAPLVRGAKGGSPRQAAARSGVALLFAGGVNASATVAILPVPALWLLTRSRGPRRRALAGWWVLWVALAAVWWAVPLVLLGRYSPPFLDWIESSEVTTRSTSILASLRGVDHWQAYLGPSEWPGAWMLVHAPAAIAATAIIAAVGLWGLLGRRVPHRAFLASCLVVGIALVTLGHVATVEPAFAPALREWLDGPLNALRNVHKFDPILRLPIAIGAGHALAALIARLPRTVDARWRGSPAVMYPRAVVLIALFAVTLPALSPALAGRVAARTRIVNQPVWWDQAARWLDEHDAGRGRALVVPGGVQPVFFWGSSREDPLQPVAESPWTVRDQLPFANAGYIRLLDAIEQQFASGQGDPLLPHLLARAGIHYLVVRNDLDTGASHATALRYVHATIDSSDGLTKAAQFGPDLVTDDPNRLVDLGLLRAQGSVDIYVNTAWTSQVAVVDAAGAVVANGSADALPGLITAGLDDARPVLFGNEPPAGNGVEPIRVLTEGIRRREASFARVATKSATMSAAQPFPDVRAAHDYLPADPGALSVVEYSGVTQLSASSSGSDANAYVNRSPAHNPYAALDGDRATAWYSGALEGAVGQWLELHLAESTAATTASLTFASTLGVYPSRIRVITDRGTVTESVRPDDRPQTIGLPAGDKRTVRLEVQAMADGSSGNGGFGVAQLSIPGLSVSRTLRVVGPAQPDVVAFSVAPGFRSSCLAVGAAPACESSWSAGGEEDAALDRTFSLARDADLRSVAQYRFVPGLATNGLLDAGNPISASSSSEDSPDPRERAGAAVDGLPDTGWVPSSTDRTPSLTLHFPATTVTAVTIAPILDAPTTRPTRVRIAIGGLDVETALPDSGKVDLPRPVRADSVRITIVASTLRVSTDSVTFGARLLPVGVGEVRLIGADAPVVTPSPVVSVGCDLGPVLTVNGVATPLQLRDVPVADVLAGRPVAATPCGSGTVHLPAGTVRMHMAATTWARPSSVRLAVPAAYLGPDAHPDDVAQIAGAWNDTDRSVRIAAAPRTRILVVRENANSGWTATLDHHRLRTVTVDGWQQGYLVPAGASGLVSLRYTPQAPFTIGLGVGLGAVVVLLLGALLPSRGRRVKAPLADGVARPWVVAVGVLASAAVLGSGWGLLVAAVVLAVRRYLPAWSAPALVVVAGLLDAARPAGDVDPLSQGVLCQVLALLAVVTVLGLPSASPRRSRDAR